MMREDERVDTLFDVRNDTITASLNGYAIIPIENFFEFIGKDKSSKECVEFLEKIRKTNEDLFDGK